MILRGTCYYRYYDIQRDEMRERYVVLSLSVDSIENFKQLARREAPYCEEATFGPIGPPWNHG